MAKKDTETAEPTVTIRLMCEHELKTIAERTIPARQRSRVYRHGDQSYEASRQDGAVWVYRHATK